MVYEGLYTQIMNGSKDAMRELSDYASSGDAEAQYVLSCVYDSADSPFKNKELAMYWLKKSAGYKYEPAIQKMKTPSAGTMTSKGMGEKADEKYTPNCDFGTKNYHPNWTKVEPHRDEESKEESSVKAANKAEKPSFGNFLFSDDGRISQSDYAIFFCIWVIFLFIIISAGSANSASPKTLQWLGFLLFYPFIQVSTKRCHDIGKWGLYLFIPFYFIYLLFVPGDKHKNEYGYPPSDLF